MQRKKIEVTGKDKRALLEPVAVAVAVFGGSDGVR